MMIRNWFLEYVWLDRQGISRSKVRVWEQPEGVKIDGVPQASDLPVWNFDASSTNQNHLNEGEHETEVVLKPVKVYRSPLDQDYFLVLCQLDLEYERVTPKLEGAAPLPGFNCRHWATRVADQFEDLEPWFGAEQEYTLLDPKTGLPYHWEEHGREEQGNYYCSARYPYSQLSDLVREHARACIDAGIKYCGFNAEVLPSQWEFQIGPADLLTVADDLVMARYLLFRLSCKYGVKVTFHPKPMRGDWNGSGCHLNFSTNLMRGLLTNGSEEDCMVHLNNCISHLQQDHPGILRFYGSDNEQRLTGQHETSSMEKFSWGIGTRHTSVRLPNQVAVNKKGYIEDRRPASNIDPYLALGKLLQASQTGSTEDQ